MKNIFEVHRRRSVHLPFIVRRENWSEQYGELVIDLEPEKTDTGIYGSAFGFCLPPTSGKSANPYWG